MAVAKEAWECEMKERNVEGSYTMPIAGMHNIHYIWAADGSGGVEYCSTPQLYPSQYWTPLEPFSLSPTRPDNIHSCFEL